MIFKERIEGEKCYLQNIDFSSDRDIELTKYVGWMNNKMVTKYLYARNGATDKEALISYVKSVNESENSYIFGIFDTKSNSYIGNVKIGPIHKAFRFGEIGFMIGEKEYWGHGYGTEAVSLICKFGFQELLLNRITSGCNELNVGSSAVLNKNGFVLEGVLRNHEYMEEIGYTNKNIYGLLRGEFLV